jgi:hypothetical protein
MKFKTLYFSVAVLSHSALSWRPVALCGSPGRGKQTTSEGDVANNTEQSYVNRVSGIPIVISALTTNWKCRSDTIR